MDDRQIVHIKYYLCTMRYIVRALKYFVYLAFLLVIFVLVIWLIMGQGAPIASMFKDGVNSFWKMALIVAAFAALYPSFGYGKRRIRAKGATDEILPKIEDHMVAAGYELVSRDDDGNAVFRKASFLGRLTRMFEDKVRFTRELSGYEMEGKLKDIVRLDTAFYDIFQQVEE